MVALKAGSGERGAVLPGPRAVALVLALTWGIYLVVLHPWLMNWGATAEERRMPLPGDDPAADSSASLTRAITIEAPRASVWPWLVQVGQDRAGFYSYTWLENLTGADIHNAAGDKVPMAGAPLRRLGGEGTLLTVRLLEPERVIADVPGRFVLVPQSDGSTRLLVRESLAIPERSGLGWLAWDPMHFVMEQRMLRGIKERAEGVPLVPPALQALARVGWSLAGLGLLGTFLSHRRWRPWVVLPVLAVVPAVGWAGDLDAALAGFLAVGIAVAGGLALGRRWWACYLLVAIVVLLVLLLAPDAYAAFGLLFLAVLCIAAAACNILGRCGVTSTATCTGLLYPPDPERMGHENGEQRWTTDDSFAMRGRSPGGIRSSGSWASLPAARPAPHSAVAGREAASPPHHRWMAAPSRAWTSRRPPSRSGQPITSGCSSCWPGCSSWSGSPSWWSR